MSRWSSSNRLTVEECKSISTKFLNKYHFFNGGIRSNWICWEKNEEETGSVGFEISTVEGNENIRFQYLHINNLTNKMEELDYKVRLTWTPCYFGGRRWWFRCPISKNNALCNRRVGILYLADGVYFGCRICHNLTYQSCKTHDKRIDALIKSPSLMSSYMNSASNSKKFLALHASVKIDERKNRSYNVL